MSTHPSRHEIAQIAHGAASHLISARDHIPTLQTACVARPSYRKIHEEELCIQEYIIDCLCALCRTYPILVEEQDGILDLREKFGNKVQLLSSEDTLPNSFWAIDPLDGTGVYPRGRDYAISIALIKDGRPVVGAIFLPRYGALLTAEEGQGAYAYLHRIWTPPLPDRDLQVYGIDICRYSNREFDQKVAIPLAQASRYTQNTPCVAGMARLALGEFSCWVSGHLKIWDMAAAWLIFTETCPDAVIEGTHAKPLQWGNISLGPVIAAYNPEVRRDIFTITGM